MGADGGGEEVGLEVRGRPPGVGDLGGRGGLLLELCGVRAGGIVGGEEGVDGVGPVAKRGGVGGDMELELLVGRLRLRLCERLLEALRVLLAFLEGVVALADGAALAGGEGAEGFVDEGEFVGLLPVREDGAQGGERRVRLFVGAPAHVLVEGACEQQVLFRRRLGFLGEGDCRVGDLLAGFLSAAQGVHLRLHDLLHQRLGRGDLLRRGHGGSEEREDDGRDEREEEWFH